MRSVRLYWPMLIGLLLTVARPATAQPQPASFETPLTGSIASAGVTESWTFSGAEGMVMSALAVADGDFDPIISLSSSAGRLLIRNDDYAFPGRRDALLQAITLPRTDTYTLTVAGVGDSTGSYTLTLWHGYAALTLRDDFEEGAADWQPSTSQLTVDRSVGRLTLATQGNGQGGYVTDPTRLTGEDFYARVRVVQVSGRAGWHTGLILRRAGAQYYRLIFNHNGAWRLTAHAGDQTRVVRDWTTHPAIRAGQTSFNIGVLANGRGFDVFYDNFYVGQAVDAAYARPTGEAGAIATLIGYEVGLYTGTPEAASASVTTEFDDLSVTEPLMLGGQTIIPDQLMPGALGLTVQELERRHLIPPGGQQALSVPQSNGQLASSGVQRVLLARGVTFGELVLGTSFTVTAGQGTVGCGLLFGHSDEANYTLAFLDKTGGYGVSQRVNDVFQPGLFGESSNSAWREGRQELIIVRLADRLHYYVNRQHVGMMALAVSEGEVGGAVINYDPINTTCQFTDTWGWAWDK